MISSPCSDLFAQGMILYVLIKWITRLEENKTDYKYYMDLCLMSIFAVSIKLSATMIVLLAMAPAVRIIRKKKWKEMGVYIIYGSIMVLPFLIRNVIISGYLIYPYPELDLFHFDWKIPAYTLLYDRNQIKVWGNGLKDVTRYNAVFSEWFSVWKEELSRLQLLEVYAFPILSVISLAIGMVKAFKNKIMDSLCVVVVMIALVLFWLLGAPSLRFGGAFLLLLPCFVIGKLAEWFNDRIKTENMALVLMLICIVYNGYPVIRTLVRSGFDNKMIESDYEIMDCREVNLGTERFYIPIEGDQIGYYSFPSSPYEQRLSIIEMRSNNLKDGFRMKKEYKNAFVTNYGDVMEENIFK